MAPQAGAQINPRQAEPPPPTAATASAPTTSILSASAKRIYEQSRLQLLQIRTLLKGQDSQSSVGSGFIVSEDGLVITNYHVVSQFALEPERYRLRFATTDGIEGPIDLIDIDVRHDLALLRLPVKSQARRGALQFRPQDQPLTKGERIYSMGNPRDVTFAVVEGNFNGLVERSFDPLIYYAGSINPGMSGGPVLDDQGRVVGINVSAMIFAEQMSFLVPAKNAAALLVRSGKKTQNLATPAWATITQQLQSYQDDLTKAFLAQPWRDGGHEKYQLPMPAEQFMRCWGGNTASDTKGIKTESTRCRMEHNVFVRDSLRLGYLDFEQLRMDGQSVGPLRFSQAYSRRFGMNANMPGGKERTAPQCKESFVESNRLPLRAVVCLSAYKKLKGLYDLDVLVATVDQSDQGAQGQFEASGVSFDNAMKLTTHYLKGFGWKSAR
ncbi:MAG TPA: serine protease [Aquabacterium sp.]|nr:serine protease [Aquabacterium sp.]